MGKDDNKSTELDDIPHERSEPRPDFSVPPPRKKLPKSIQDTLDNDEKLWETMYEGKSVLPPPSDPTESSAGNTVLARNLKSGWNEHELTG